MPPQEESIGGFAAGGTDLENGIAGGRISFLGMELYGVFPVKRPSQVARWVHAVMQDSHYDDAITRYAEVDHMPFNDAPSISGPDVVASCCGFRGFGQLCKNCCQRVCVAVRLLDAPLPGRVRPNFFQIAPGGRCKAVFSHARAAFAA